MVQPGEVDAGIKHLKEEIANDMGQQTSQRVQINRPKQNGRVPIERGPVT